MSETGSTSSLDLYPNLGAEEGDDWAGYQEIPAVRDAARLWSLLFGSNARLRIQGQDKSWTTLQRDTLWPPALGAPQPNPVFPSLSPTAGSMAWLNTQNLEDSVSQSERTALSGPRPEIVTRVHDKAFAARAARDLGLIHRSLAPLVEVLEPEELRQPDTLLSKLQSRLEDWPDWTQRSFTLKPRFGSSGRGRAAGRDRVDTPQIRGACSRLADHGGGLFEPWLDRTGDYSVCLSIPESETNPPLPTILGSLEMWCTPGGLVLGHCGEVDSRGRVFSGDSEDESLRADAAAVAALAHAEGFFGPCGVDSFRYHERLETAGAPTERMRGGVEFNARATMGLVTIGLVRRALADVREPLALTPGDRRGFALIYRFPGAEQRLSSLRDRFGVGSVLLDLSASPTNSDATPVLLFTRDLATLREARQELLDC